MSSNKLHRVALLVAGLSGAMAVGMGAWAAHGSAFNDLQRQLIEKGSLYGMIHAVALLAAAALGVRWAVGLFIVGLGFFPTTLYLLGMDVTQFPRILTPVGGTALIAGWIAVAYAGLRK